MKTTDFKERLKEFDCIFVNNVVKFVNEKDFDVKNIAFISPTNKNYIDIEHNRIENELFDLLIEYTKTPINDREQRYIWKLKGFDQRLCIMNDNQSLIGFYEHTPDFQVYFTKQEFLDLKQRFGFGDIFEKVPVDV